MTSSSPTPPYGAACPDWSPAPPLSLHISSLTRTLCLSPLSQDVPQEGPCSSSAPLARILGEPALLPLPRSPKLRPKEDDKPVVVGHGWSCSSQGVLARATGAFGHPLGGDTWLPTCHHSKLGAGPLPGTSQGGHRAGPGRGRWMQWQLLVACDMVWVALSLLGGNGCRGQAGAAAGMSPSHGRWVRLDWGWIWALGAAHLRGDLG